VIKLKPRLGRSPTLVFDLVDNYALTLKLFGENPRPRAPARFTVIAQVVDGVDQPLEPPRHLLTRQTSRGYDLYFDQFREVAPDGSEGETFRRRLRAGDYIVRITCPGYQKADVPVTIPDVPPDAPSAITQLLQPGFDYPFPLGRRGPGQGLPGPTLVAGSVLGADGRGVEGVVVRLRPPPDVDPYLTDTSGQWVLVLPDPAPDAPPESVDIEFQYPDGQLRQVPGVPFFGGGPSRCPQQSLAGRVMDQDGVAVGGAELTVAGQPGSSRSGSDATWIFVFPPGEPAAADVDVTARLPDGRQQTQTVTVEPDTRVRVPDFQF
jgi:hypothetical protein